MAMDNELFQAILAMDAYHRGYDKAIRITESSDQLGTAAIILDSLETPNTTDGQNQGFYASAYSWNGQTIISYRGTSTSSFSATFTDVYTGWLMGGGIVDSQAGLALRFYQDVAATQSPDVDLGVTVTLAITPLLFGDVR
jgi:hypothetical protein